jgi:hypothetical protein
MSALGQKQTFRSATAVSAFPPTADKNRHGLRKQKDRLAAVSPKFDQE